MTLAARLLLCLAVALVGSWAQAGEHRKEWKGWANASAEPAWIEIHEPDEDHRGAHAAVTFSNRVVHNQSEEFELTLGDFTVLVIFDWNFEGGQAERMTVIPPPGYVAQPPELSVEEGTQGTIYIFGATS